MLLLVVACLWMVVLHGWWFGDSVAGVVLACWIFGKYCLYARQVGGFDRLLNGC